MEIDYLKIDFQQDSYNWPSSVLHLQDASIAYDVKLTGILSTHTPSPGDNPENPEFASIVHPGVSAQFHQHLFCCRMDWALDDKSGMDDLVVSEVGDSAQHPTCFVTTMGLLLALG